jgi:uncharacterized protein with PIN domain
MIFFSGMAVRTPYQGECKFVLDSHLGRLARYLRMLGFDAWYRNHEFYLCLQCDKVYWPGSHYEDMKQFIENIIEEDGCI